jgi:hypothetical protein
VRSEDWAAVGYLNGIPPAEKLAGLNLPADTPPDKQLKEVMRANKMEVDDLRDWLKKRTKGTP